MADAALARTDRIGPGGTARDHPAVASSRVSGLLALKSRGQPGRPKIGCELRELIRRMNKDNPLWGAPRIHGELLKLGFEIAESTVSKYRSNVEDRRRRAGVLSCTIMRMPLWRSISAWSDVMLAAAPSQLESDQRPIEADSFVRSFVDVAQVKGYYRLSSPNAQ
jgi:hypothetical protein